MQAHNLCLETVPKARGTAHAAASMDYGRSKSTCVYPSIAFHRLGLTQGRSVLLSLSTTAQSSTRQGQRSNGMAVQPLRSTAPLPRQLQTVIPLHPSQNKAVFSLSSVPFWKGKKLRSPGVLLYVRAVRLTLWTDLAQTGPKVPPGHTLSLAFPKDGVGMDCSPSKSQQHGQSATSYSTCLHA